MSDLGAAAEYNADDGSETFPDGESAPLASVPDAVRPKLTLTVGEMDGVPPPVPSPPTSVPDPDSPEALALRAARMRLEAEREDALLTMAKIRALKASVAAGEFENDPAAGDDARVQMEALLRRLNGQDPAAPDPLPSLKTDVSEQKSDDFFRWSEQPFGIGIGPNVTQYIQPMILLISLLYLNWCLYFFHQMYNEL